MATVAISFLNTPLTARQALALRKAAELRTPIERSTCIAAREAVAADFKARLHAVLAVCADEYDRDLVVEHLQRLVDEVKGK